MSSSPPSPLSVPTNLKNPVPDLLLRSLFRLCRDENIIYGVTFGSAAPSWKRETIYSSELPGAVVLTHDGS